MPAFSHAVDAEVRIMGTDGDILSGFFHDAETRLLRGVPCEDLVLWAREWRIRMVRERGRPAVPLDAIRAQLRGLASTPCKRAAYLAICEGLEEP
jgi:hypothetical protein